MFSAADHEFMARALRLAESGLYSATPNPRVGCVLVRDGSIVGEGWHEKAGGPHAEVNAIASVQDETLLKQATLYVNLEPCSHYGKTPPCADLILTKQIPRVVIGSYDPNPKVAGKGIQRLKDAGVEVTTEVLKAESDFLNRRFLTYHTLHRPYVLLKWAQSSDGYMGLNEPKQLWLTNAESKKLSHQWRTEEQAILVGRNTVMVDDSELTARLWPGNNPLRVVIDRNLALGHDKKIFNNKADTLIVNELKEETTGNLHYCKIDFTTDAPAQILHLLYQRNILSVIVEGGAQTLQSFIAVNLWDEARIFTTPHTLKNGIPAPVLPGKLIEETAIEKDTLQVLLNNRV